MQEREKQPTNDCHFQIIALWIGELEGTSKKNASIIEVLVNTTKVAEAECKDGMWVC